MKVQFLDIPIGLRFQLRPNTIVNSSDFALRASSFALQATTGQDDGTRRMGLILPCCLPNGKAGGLQILCCQGINVTDYNFNLDAWL